MKKREILEMLGKIEKSIHLLNDDSASRMKELLTEVKKSTELLSDLDDIDLDGNDLLG